MLKPGDVVLQKKTMVNKTNFKDNKPNRLSVVLFSYVNDNGKLYYCTAPITNATRGTFKKKMSNNFYYMPNSIYTYDKLCCVKLDSIFLYSEDIVRGTGLSIDLYHVMNIYKGVLNLDVEYYQEKFYNFVKILIRDNVEEYIKEAKKEEKNKKKLFKKK